MRWDRASWARSSELRKIKQLEGENSKLKRLVADLSLDKIVLQDAIGLK